MTNEARTEKRGWGKLALESGMGKISPWMIFRKYFFLFVADWKSIPSFQNIYLLASFCFFIRVHSWSLLKAWNRLIPQIIWPHIMKHCCIIQDATCMAAEWHNAAQSQTENNSLARHLQGQKALFVTRACGYKSVRSHRCKTLGSSALKPVTSKIHDLDWHTTWNYAPSAVLSW